MHVLIDSSLFFDSKILEVPQFITMSVHEDVTDLQLATMNAAQLVHQVDHHNPLYIYPSDTQSSVLISIQLQGSENYSI